MNYTPEEQKLIDFIKDLDKPTTNINEIAELLFKVKGNMTFNAKLRKDKSPEGKEARVFLEYYTFKTRGYEEFKPIASKLDVALALRDNKLPLEEYEKITLAEYSRISELQSLNAKAGSLLQRINDGCNNADYHELYSNIKKSSAKIEELSKGALESNDYKAGDLMLYLTAKTTVLKGREQKYGHEGKLERMFVTKYNHAAHIHINNSDPDKPTATKSDIWKQQRSEALSLGEILQSDALRIDPVKLVDKKQAALLEQVYYGSKKNDLGQDIPITWQEAMKDRYEGLSNALHMGQVSYQIGELEKQSKECDKELEDLREEMKPYRRKLEEYLEVMEEIKPLADKMGDPALTEIDRNEITKQIETIVDLKDYHKLKAQVDSQKGEYDKLKSAFAGKDLESEEVKKQIENKKSELLANDQSRLNAKHWIDPKTIKAGHTQWFSENDLRDMSQKMYNATPDQRQMVCSEFAARSIGSVIDQLNRITGLDLPQDEGKGTEVVVRNPISSRENFNNLHPERLFDILTKSGCVEKIENQFLKDFIQLENTDKSLPKSVEYTANLPKKIYGLLSNSQDLEDFKDKATKATGVYLKAAGVKPDVIAIAKEQVLSSKLEDIYKQHTKKPEGIVEKIQSACIQVLEFCHLRTKDSSTKKNLDVMVQGIKENISSTEQLRQKRSFEEKNIPLAEVEKLGKKLGKIMADSQNIQSDQVNSRSRAGSVNPVIPTHANGSRAPGI